VIYLLLILFLIWISLPYEVIFGAMMVGIAWCLLSLILGKLRKGPFLCYYSISLLFDFFNSN
jgi:hypothetical protein